MDRFHFIDVKPTIDRKETASTRDAIFKRAREKAEALTEEKNENYTTQIQNDVMEIARESIRPSQKNPFNQFLENMNVQNKAEVTERTVKPKDEFIAAKEEFSRRIKHNIESINNKTYTDSVKDETMEAARSQFRQGTNLMATLSFLNTKAAIKMAENAHSKINRVS